MTLPTSRQAREGRRPTPSQTEVIRYFATGMPPASRIRTTEATYRVCREQGWMEATDVWPYHQTTPKGRAAIGLPERHGTCGTCQHDVHEYPSGWAHTAQPLACAKLVPVNIRP